MTSGSRLLTIEHRHLYGAARDALRTCAQPGDPRESVERYRSIERVIVDHFEAEEVGMLVGYTDVAPVEAREIRDRHEVIRQQLFRAGIAVELHAPLGDSLPPIDDQLRVLELRVEPMYRWADLHLPISTKRHLFTRLRHGINELRARLGYESSTASHLRVEHTGYTR